MSFVSFALVYVTYALIIRMLGSNGIVSRYSQLIIIPIVVIAYNMFLLTSPYRYWLGSIPILIMALILFNFYVIKGGKMKNKGTPQEEYQGNRKMRRAKNFEKRKGI